MFGIGQKGESPYVIAGLGNPGRGYENTRHNVGFRAVDNIARRFSVEFKKNKFNGEITDIKFSGHKIILVKPMTYMNNSGECIWRVVGFYKPELIRLIVIYDDIDLPPGALRVRQFGGPGTHNGMRSVVDALGSDRFPRIRIGVGKPSGGPDLKDYVLSGFGEDEKPVIESVVSEAAAAAIDIVEFGVEKSMNMHNSPVGKQR